MLGRAGPGSDPYEALGDRPPELANVAPDVWDRLLAAHRAGAHRAEFLAASTNGRRFLEAADGLRGRAPARVEWKGPTKPVGYDAIPADLRVDHVYLVSCKYLSTILHNVSPAHLFERCLAERHGETTGDWYQEVSPAAYAELYSEVRRHVDPESLPADLGGLSTAHRAVLKAALARQWPAALVPAYRSFCEDVAHRSAQRWSARLPALRDREVMLWRLLRLAPAPYFVLGTAPAGSLRLRIATPWDWRQRFSLSGFDIVGQAAGQPLVTWRAEVRDLEAGDTRIVEGYVEVRWSHGRFHSFPEAKVHLATPHSLVPGYFPLG
ncbi:MAG TPA: hypothetical protein VFA11_05785 [Acidimicrobiales bacterium]|nr:hypothetical protein [Acidimicrobiales bacterium]